MSIIEPRPAILVLAALATACGSGLASHADSVRDRALRAEVSTALRTIERLRRDEWLARIASGACSAQSDSSACIDALDALASVQALRSRIERERDDAGALDAFRLAVADGTSIDDECTGSDALRSIAAAVVRHVAELSVAPPREIEVPEPMADCRIATLGGPVLLTSEPRAQAPMRVSSVIVLRGDVLPGVSSKTATYDFSDDLPAVWFDAPRAGPWSDAPAVQVELWQGTSIDVHLVVRAADGWRVIDFAHVGDT
ncbi:hypothetical protein [Sandaracinus amylolyticus]|uniref:hypothetical protein n=1 Tax=Sandaracinus amylolyticus TaxID=927083 RepID=UPI001F3EB825|nr:hypothetical protein [Sandaracinus amylolyticus]UJR80483.1 Hypothetical protein I5071_25300 [Sandaracinus amylolyticus]